MDGEWLHWYYLIYLVPAGMAVLVLLLSGLGGHHSGGGHHAHGGLHLHAHHGAGHLHLHQGGAHAGHAAHGQPGHVHAAHTHGHAGADRSTGQPSAAQQLLGFFGIGRAPITIVVGSMLLGWGLLGFAVNEWLRPVLHFPALFMGPSLVVAAVGALMSGKLFGELAARLMPKDESYAISREGLLGLTGSVVYAVSESEGRVHVFDAFRTLHTVSARVAPGEAPIAKGIEVIIASLDPAGRFAIVEPLGFRTAKPSLAEERPVAPKTERKPVAQEEAVVEIRRPEESR